MKKRKKKPSTKLKALTGWKFAGTASYKPVILKLRIPAGAKRVNHLKDKARAEYVKVLGIYGVKKLSFYGRKLGKKLSIKTAYNAIHCGADTTYTVGKITYPDAYDPNPKVTCGRGIHYHRKVSDALDWC